MFFTILLTAHCFYPTIALTTSLQGPCCPRVLTQRTASIQTRKTELIKVLLKT